MSCHSSSLPASPVPHVMYEVVLPALCLLLTFVGLLEFLLVALKEMLVVSAYLSGSPNKFLHGIGHDLVLWS